MMGGRGIGVRRGIVSGLAFGLALFGARDADAFCGFYVSGADTSLFNEATQVVLMRDGTRTVLSMQNDYKGPPEDFALVVPVPVVLQKENVKILNKDVFANVDKLTAPRLVEYWEQDPCAGIGLGNIGTLGHGAGTGTGQGFGNGHGRVGGADLGVTVAAEFAVGEYEILILDAKSSSGLDTWLHLNNYKIPAGAADVLKPYVSAGSKFFVAKVDTKKVKFENGRAALSPLRFHYDTDKFELPVKLGLLNSSGTQDLIVYVIGRDRFEVSNYPNVTIPTNLDVSEKARESFGPFYASLYDDTVHKHPNSVVTEYSWGATSCDPCPGGVSGMSGTDIASLGADVMTGFKVTSGGGGGSSVSLRQGTTTVSPGLPPEVVQRIVRQNFGRFRLCYQNGLQSNPALSGRVTVKFDIGPDGSVKDAKDGGSELPDTSVVSCVVRSFSGLSFPEPEGKKKVSVTYPIIFSPGGSGGSGGSGSGIGGGVAQVSVPLTVTRLHARYTKTSLGADLVFKVADPIEGGREQFNDGKMDHGSKHSTNGNNFQARYAIRHPWPGKIECKEPVRNVWGGPWPDAGAAPELGSATNLGLVPHGSTTLTSFISDGSKVEATTLVSDAGPPAPMSLDGGTVDAKPAPSSSKCGCRAVGEPTSSANPFGLLLLGMLAAARRRSRPDAS